MENLITHRKHAAVSLGLNPGYQDRKPVDLQPCVLSKTESNKCFIVKFTKIVKFP
jgi:hypothetical protein